MELSKNGYELIKQFEGVKNTSYQDSIGKWTIGIGFITYLGKPVTKGMTLTNDQIEKEFFLQVRHYVQGVNNCVKSKLTQNQFDTLVSFVWNLGIGALQSSTLLKKVNENPNDLSIREEFIKWCKAGGKTIPGLLNRRQKEAAVYFS